MMGRSVSSTSTDRNTYGNPFPFIERRVEPRQQMNKAATVVYANGMKALDCTISDWSDGGAKLLIPEGRLMPRRFDLHISDGRILCCELRWAKYDAFGVRFVLAA